MDLEFTKYDTPAINKRPATDATTAIIIVLLLLSSVVFGAFVIGSIRLTDVICVPLELTVWPVVVVIVDVESEVVIWFNSFELIFDVNDKINRRLPLASVVLLMMIPTVGSLIVSEISLKMLNSISNSSSGVRFTADTLYVCSITTLSAS